MQRCRGEGPARARGRPGCVRVARVRGWVGVAAYVAALRARGEGAARVPSFARPSGGSVRSGSATLKGRSTLVQLCNGVGVYVDVRAPAVVPATMS